MLCCYRLMCDSAGQKKSLWKLFCTKQLSLIMKNYIIARKLYIYTWLIKFCGYQ